MSEETFEQFRQLVLSDLSIQERLRATVERAEFIRLIIDLGAERGYKITSEAVEEAMRASRRAWFERWI